MRVFLHRASGSQLGFGCLVSTGAMVRFVRHNLSVSGFLFVHGDFLVVLVRLRVTMVSLDLVGFFTHFTKMLLEGTLVLTVLVALRERLLLLVAGQLVGRKHGACRTYLNNVEIAAAEPGGSLFNKRDGGFSDHRRVLQDPQMGREGSRFLLLVMKCQLGRQEFHLSAPRVDRLDTFRERRKVVPLSAGRQWCQWGVVLGCNSLKKIFVLLHSY
jgi:hypothetical protein